MGTYASSERIAAQNLLDGLKKSAAESREKLNLLNARCDACDALMLLRRFESLHALEQKSTDLRQALAQLPEQMQEVIHLIYFEELTYDEAAKIMKKSKKQVDNLLYRSKNMLRTILGKEGEQLI